MTFSNDETSSTSYNVRDITRKERPQRAFQNERVKEIEGLMKPWRRELQRQVSRIAASERPRWNERSY